MKKLESLNFQTHAHLKNIVGQEMINEDNIAIKELVKNSIDAEAKQVRIRFENTENPDENSQIIIQDDGLGMSLEDLKRKWLNIAYSSKKRDKSRNFAGNKGIGRFSADRLGQKLHLFTRQKGEENFILLEIDWGKFEEKDNWQDKIEEIDIQSYSLTQSDIKKNYNIDPFKQGTLLWMYDLRFSWDRDKLLGLKRDLEKFIIPKQVEGSEDFQLFLEAPEFDKENKEPLSGKITNQVFDKLPFKTSYITSQIDKDGKYITTELFHRGELLVKLIEKNKFSLLSDVYVILFYLNPYQKAFFARETGTRAVEYGSIFLYLNGFRVPPYGEQEDDWLRIDRRRAQGHSRYIGTRELLGRIEVKDKTSKTFKVTSDREGLVGNEAFSQIGDVYEGFFNHVFRKFEKFVVDGLSWDSTPEDTNSIVKRVESFDSNLDKFQQEYSISEDDKERHLTMLLDTIIFLNTRKDDVQSLEFGDKALTILQKQQKEDLDKLQEKLDQYSLKVKTGGKNFRPADLAKTLKTAERQVSGLQKQVDHLAIKKQTAEHKLKVEEKKRLFAEATTTLDHSHVLNMHHQIGLIAGKVYKSFDRTIRKYNEDSDNYTKQDLISLIEKGLFDIDKIRKASKFASRANFDLATNNVKDDLVQFIEEYVSSFQDHIVDWNLNIRFENKDKVSFVKNFRPIEATMLIDNIIDNAGKARAKNILINVARRKNNIEISFIDDGAGVDEEKYKPEELFDKGITTTSGSGIGLYHIKQIVSDLKGIVKIENNPNKGVALVLEFPEK